MCRFYVNSVVVILFSMFSILVASENNDEDKTLSPYFLIDSEESGTDGLPLLSTDANVTIAGVIADITVTQVYKNSGNTPIEAVYVFPASTRAAVYALRMTLDGRTIDARVKEREQARKDYEAARQQGKTASLLEQQRPNVFQMNVANILPGDTIKVELRYTEMLVPRDNVYEFVYPTVVGPRYSNSTKDIGKKATDWVQNPYLKQGVQPTYTFDIHVGIQTGIPIQDMVCPTHKINIQYDTQASASAALDKSETDGGNRDFILHYRLAGDQIESGMLLYKGEKENFFCMMVQPPQRVTNSNIPSREYIFVVDVSGSMNGFPLDISRELLRNLISGLRPSDSFNVLLFAGVSNLMSQRSLPATEENIKKAIEIIDRQQGNGGTELLPALKRSLNLPKNEAVSRSIIVVTDGYVDVEAQAFDLIRENLDKANVFAFGIGSSVNRLLIEGMARVGGGEPFIVTTPQKGQEIAETFRTYIQNPVLTQIHYSFDGFSAYDVEPVSVPDVMASRPILIYGKWKGTPAGRVMVSGYTGGKQKYEQVFNVREVKASPSNAALRYLWARNRIALLDDYNNLSADDERIKEVTSLGLTYNLLTAYTSFVAIDNEIRNKSGNAQTVQQPLPLPQGVSDLAVGYGAAPASMSLKRKSLSPKSLNNALPSYPGKAVAMEREVADKLMEVRADKDEEKLKNKSDNTITFTAPDRVRVHGKTVLYFWKSLMSGALKEIELMIAFAQKNSDITIVVINTEVINSQLLANVIYQVTGKSTVPSNVQFVADPANVLMSYANGGLAADTKPLILFTTNGTVKNSIQDYLNVWGDYVKVRKLF